MSVKVSALCWKVPLAATEKLVLLRMADFADDQGFNIYPAVQTVADDCGIGIRIVQLTLKKMVSKGILVVMNQGGGRGRATEYAIDMDLIRQLRDAPPTASHQYNGHAEKGAKGVNSAPRSPFTAVNPESDDINPAPDSPHPSLPVKEGDEEDDAGAPEGVLQQVTERVAGMAGISGKEALERNAPIAAGWLKDGADPDADIYPAVANAMNRTSQTRIRGFAYFTDEIKTQQRARLMPKQEISNVRHIHHGVSKKQSGGSYISRCALGLPV
jgi:hypothetical protein